MKGFLQKMAYTIQTIVLFGGLAIMGYNKQITSATKAINESTKAGIGIICFAIPPILIFISLIVFTKKFKLHGNLQIKYTNILLKREITKKHNNNYRLSRWL
jgi:Na+/melibiose symporter-like transporter